MSECHFVFAGPPADWTVSRIKEHMAQIGLLIRPGASQRAYEEIRRQFEAGEQFGFEEARIAWIEQLTEQYENGCWEFVNPGCPHCMGPPSGCIKIWRLSDGSFVTNQCNSAMVDYGATEEDIHRVKGRREPLPQVSP